MNEAHALLGKNIAATVAEQDRRIAELEARLNCQQPPENAFDQIHNAAVSAKVAGLNRRIAELEAELSSIVNAIPGVRYLDPPDGGSVTVSEQVSRMAEEVARLSNHIRAIANHHADAIDKIGFMSSMAMEHQNRRDFVLSAIK